MAANQPKTDMINLALLKLHGVTDAGTQIIETAIDDTVFAAPTTADGANKETVKLACTVYPRALKKALRDIKPKFARQYADCGKEILVTLDNSTPFEKADWEKMFELPSDFIALVSQVDEADIKIKYDARETTAHSWSHIAEGSDSQAYYCDTTHTSTSGANDGQPPTDDVTGNWTLFNATGSFGAEWEALRAYKANETSKLLLAREYSNVDGDAAYIEYIGYVEAGFADVPTYYDEHFVQAFAVLLAAMMASWSAEAGRRTSLLAEYERFTRPRAIAKDMEPDYEEPVVSWLDARML